MGPFTEMGPDVCFVYFIRILDETVVEGGCPWPCNVDQWIEGSELLGVMANSALRSFSNIEHD
jgi:hypothetical protein